MKKEKLFSNNFLNSLKKNSKLFDSNLRNRMLSHPNLPESRVEEFNKMWNEIIFSPADNKFKLKEQLLKGDEGVFRGAWGEFISAWFLSKYTKILTYQPKVRRKRPDFYFYNPKASFFCETIFLSRDMEKRKSSRLTDKLREEIQDIKDVNPIILIGDPIPNENGNFKGMNKELKIYLEKIKKESFPLSDHRLEVNGAIINFDIIKTNSTGNVFGGIFGEPKWGCPTADRLTCRINDKLDKYEFPFVLICVLESILDLQYWELIKVLYGDLIAQINVSKDLTVQINADPVMKLSNSGVWGKENENFDRNLRLNAIVLVYFEETENDSFNINIGIEENPYINIGLDEIFSDIPKVLNHKNENYNFKKF